MGNRQTNKIFWKIDKLYVFFTKTFFDNIRPIEKTVMTGFRHGVKGEVTEGVGARGSQVATPQNVMTFQFEIIYNDKSP